MHRHARQRQFLVVSVHPYRNAGAAAERGEQILIRIGAGILTADVDRLVGARAMRPELQIADIVTGAALDDQRLAVRQSRGQLRGNGGLVHGGSWLGSGICIVAYRGDPPSPGSGWPRSEEHTSELQSLMRISYDVLFFKKKH